MGGWPRRGRAIRGSSRQMISSRESYDETKGAGGLATPERASRLMEQQGTSTVLIVNDLVDHLEFMNATLRTVGYRVLMASDGREAFDTARHHHPDLIISDVMMPRMDGIELCRLVRADADLRLT